MELSRNPEQWDPLSAYVSGMRRRNLAGTTGRIGLSLHASCMQNSSLLRASVVLAVVLGGPLAAADKRPVEVEDLFRLHRLSDPQISPDGKRVAYVVTDVVKAENRTDADIWVTNADGRDRPTKLTNSPKHDRHPRWSPDGKWIAFESAREGVPQIYVLPTAGGEPKKLTTLSTGASQPIWSPDGKSVAFVSAVYPAFSNKPFAEADRLNRETTEAWEKGKVKARLIENLLYRHWDAWVENKRLHIFVVNVKSDGTAEGEPRDVTPGENDAQPTSSTFAAGDELAFSTNSKELFFTAPPVPLREQAWSTNHDIWAARVDTGAKRQITTNLAADGHPRPSPNGKWMAYRAQARAGFEADRWEIWLLDLASGEARSLTRQWDYSVDEIAWAADSTALWVEAQDKGSRPLWRVPIDGSEITRVPGPGSKSEISVSPVGNWAAFTQQSFVRPGEIARIDNIATPAKVLTQANDELLDNLQLSQPESVIVSGAGGTPVQMYIVKPPGFDPTKKYPLVFWVHGGPQSAFLDAWSTRWNPQVWAAQGYVVSLANPRGSTGFGQKFTDEISQDWGGQVFEDLMACLSHLEKQPYIDTGRMAAAGASFGGYMMNWFEGHTDKFRCLINHDGVYNFDSMYGTTEELWFDEWEHGIPWENPDFNKFSPHRFAAKFSTPMLVIHNDLDFRVPITEGLQVFTVLQRKGIPSKLLMFPDEGHWVLKPQNSELWHKTIFDWLGSYLKN